jgi:hypothetical protein
MTRSKTQTSVRWRLRCLALAVGIGLPAAMGFASSPASADASTACFGLTLGTGSIDAALKPVCSIILSIPCLNGNKCPISKLYVSGS